MKSALRKTYLSLRSGIPPEERLEKNQAICQHLFDFVDREGFDNCFLYCSYRDEPDLGLFFVRSPCPLAVPVITGRSEMEFRRYIPGEALVVNERGIAQPPRNDNHPIVMPSKRDLIVAPAVAMDRFGTRLGYGGGFYDRYLKTWPGPVILGVVYDCGIAEKLPRDSHDKGVDFILTESGLLTIQIS